MLGESWYVYIKLHHHWLVTREIVSPGKRRLHVWCGATSYTRLPSIGRPLEVLQRLDVPFQLI